MDFKKKRKEVSSIIHLYLRNEKTLQELQDYAWEIIDECSGNDTQADKPLDGDKSIFWFAIWQIQHLANQEHLKDGTLERELKLTLQYLLNQSPIPLEVRGLPPINNAKKNIK